MWGASSAVGPLNNVSPYSIFIQKAVHLIVIKPLLQLLLYLLSFVHVDFEFVGFVAQWWCHDALHTMSRVLF